MSTSEEALELLRKHLGLDWRPKGRGDPFDLIKGEEKIEIKSSADKSFDKSFGAVSLRELIESLMTEK